jgi:hypothetical protein
MWWYAGAGKAPAVALAGEKLLHAVLLLFATADNLGVMSSSVALQHTAQ